MASVRLGFSQSLGDGLGVSQSLGDAMVVSHSLGDAQKKAPGASRRPGFPALRLAENTSNEKSRPPAGPSLCRGFLAAARRQRSVFVVNLHEMRCKDQKLRKKLELLRTAAPHARAAGGHLSGAQGLDARRGACCTAARTRRWSPARGRRQPSSISS